MTKAPRMHAINICLKQTGFDNFSGRQCCCLWQEVVLLKQSLRPLLASLSVNYFFDHNHTCGLLNISAWYLGIDLLNLSSSENFNLKNFPEEHSEKKSVPFAVLMGTIVPILPLYTVSLGPLYHKILYPPLKMVYQ